MHNTKAHVSKETKFDYDHYVPIPFSMRCYPVGCWSNNGRAIAAEEKKNQENDAPPEEIKRKIVFSDLRNPPNNFTLLFGEVAKFRTLTKKDEQ